MEDIKSILIKRDGLTMEEAEELYNEAKKELEEYIRNGEIDSAYHICQDYFGLEPDYLMELM